MQENKAIPYLSDYDENVIMYNIFNPPPLEGFNDSKELSLNLTLGEVRKSSFVTDAEKNQFYQIPIDSRLIQAFQIIREALNSPITLSSSFRSYSHEIKKGRFGTSQHVEGKAFDLVGVGLVDLLKEALSTKNKLYQRLRAVGVNGVGIYENKNFIHIDTREPNYLGGYDFWSGEEDDEIKKKSSSSLLTKISLGISLVMVAVGIYKKIKDWRR